jgi:Icc protein
LKQYFDPLKIPVLALPGNHDDAGLLAEIFPGSPTGTPRVSEHGAWQIIRLNSCLPGKPEGRLDEKVLVELENILASDAGRPRLVALHHQPISTGSPWIDKYRLLEPEALLQVIDRYRDIKAVVWGHVHQAFEADRNGTVMLGGPSSAINCLPGAQKFSPDPNGPAFRWLDLRVDGTLLSKLMGNSQH